MRKERSSSAPPEIQRQLKLLLKAFLRLGRTPEIRQERVRSISQEVRKKSYRIDCRKLADCIITGLLFGLLR